MLLNSSYTRDNLHAEGAHKKEGDICPSLYLQISRHVCIYVFLQHCIAIAVGCRPVYTSLYLRLSPTSMSACISHGRGYTCIYICIDTDRRHSHAVGCVYQALRKTI